MWPNTTIPQIGAAMAEVLERVNGDEPHPQSPSLDGEGGNNEVARLQAQVAHYKALANGEGDKFDQLTERIDQLSRENRDLKRERDNPKPEYRKEGQIEVVPLSAIIRDAGTQSRALLDEKTVERYMTALEAGDKFPPLSGVQTGEGIVMRDGFHRHEAMLRLGWKECRVDVVQGSLSDAIWLSLSANREHDKAGLARTNNDKRRAVERAFSHPNAANLSDSEIARHVGVHHSTVANYRKAILLNSQDRTPEPTPAPSMTAPATAHFPPQTTPPPRLVTRGGTTFQMQTGNIGKKPTTQVKRDEFSQAFPPDEPMLDADSGDLLPFGDDTPDLPPAQPKHSPTPLPAPLPSAPQVVSEAERAAALAQRQALRAPGVEVANPKAWSSEDADAWGTVLLLREAIIRMIDKVEGTFGLGEAQKEVINSIGRKALKLTQPD